MKTFDKKTEADPDLNLKLDNVDRGMNLVAINLEGKYLRYSTFDLYEKDSADLKAFLNLIQPGELIMIARNIDLNLSSEKIRF